MGYLHLDSEYRNRWIEFHLDSGEIEDSRLKNWREVAWNRVVTITAHLLDQVHQVKNDNPKFKTFMNFRWGGQEAIYDQEHRYIGHKQINTWTIGWTDGEICFLKDIDFYTGKLIKNYKAPLSQFIAHLHPSVKDKI